MGDGYAAIQRGGRAACSGSGGNLMTHSAGSVTTHTGTLDISNKSWQVCHALRFTFCKALIALKLKSL
jgi:hypothetical protein